MSNPLPHDHIVPYKDSVDGKKEQVADMFNRISGKYDVMNRFLSARIDILWRKKAIRTLKHIKPEHILDVATGTGDMAILAYKILKPKRITGIDISRGMLEIGIKKVDKEGLGAIIHLQPGDSETINFAENTFDAVMVAFGVRNFGDLDAGLKEMKRVLRPGGKLLVLEFSKPKSAIIRGFYKIYMGIICPQVARIFKQNREAYNYLERSANAFPDKQQFTDILKKAGYNGTGYKPLSLGICCIYTGTKP
jgi:demethylmenaquinone methyltransferase/2-methoxy-6-polyprenyl-1,4-benzoquinol methylase